MNTWQVSNKWVESASKLFFRTKYIFVVSSEHASEYFSWLSLRIL